MVPGHWPPRIVAREPGPQTVTGAGDILIDSDGNRWRVIDSGEAAMLRNSTGVIVANLYPDGTIR